jgi:uncharacterized protein YbjT (DUF2867 family)
VNPSEKETPIPNFQVSAGVCAAEDGHGRSDAGTGSGYGSPRYFQDDGRHAKAPSTTRSSDQAIQTMKVLVVGASGLIGAQVVAALRRDGHNVSAVYHRKPENDPEGLTLDLASATEADWRAALNGMDAVVNCAGVFQDNASDSTDAVHRSGVDALVRASEKAGIKRLVHFSAIGMDRAQPTDFSRSKYAGDRIVEQSGLDWVILRPSVVLGRPAYGGSALFRGLAALPVLPRFEDTKPIQPVQLDDVAKTVALMLDLSAPSKVVLELTGPDVLTVEQVVQAYRAWLGWKPATTISLPRWLIRLLYVGGDVAGWFGWRPPIRSTAEIEMRRGAVGDNRAWRSLTKIEPQSLAAALEASPASVQERWFAGLYLLKPIAFGVFALFWLTTGLISLGPGWNNGMSIMREGGAAPETAALAIVAGATADIVIGIGIAFRRTTRVALWAGVAISLAYAVIGTILVPRLWIDPLGPMLKIWPIIAFNLILLAILEDR